MSNNTGMWRKHMMLNLFKDVKAQVNLYIKINVPHKSAAMLIYYIINKCSLPKSLYGRNEYSAEKSIFQS